MCILITYRIFCLTCIQTFRIRSRNVRDLLLKSIPVFGFLLGCLREESIGVKFGENNASLFFPHLPLLLSVLHEQRRHAVHLQHQDQRVLHRKKVVRVCNDIECKQSDEAHNDEWAVLHDERHENPPHFSLNKRFEPGEARAKLLLDSSCGSSEGAAWNVRIGRKFRLHLALVCFCGQHERKLKTEPRFKTLHSA